MELRYLKREEIDKTKWNSCVHYANNGAVFGYMWYLDQLTKDWDAIVEGDYESVMPLIWKNDRRRLYQPTLLPHVGIYSIHVLSSKRIEAFLNAITSRFKVVDIRLNEKSYPGELPGFEVSTFRNYFLPLNQPFEGLYDNFDIQLKKDIEKAEVAGLLPLSDLKPEKLAAFYKSYNKESSDFNFHALQRLMWNALHRGWGFASGIADTKGDLLAVDFFIYSHGKTLSLMPTVSAEGRAQEALSYLYYMILRKHANSPLILDFNSNSIDQLAMAMGARPKKYFRLKRDKRKFRLFS